MNFLRKAELNRLSSVETGVVGIGGGWRDGFSPYVLSSLLLICIMHLSWLKNLLSCLGYEI